MEELKKLLEILEEKLAYTKQLVAEYDETMDYASHCNLLGFAEGIEFVMEEIEEMQTGKGKGKDEGRGRGRNTGRGKNKSEGRGQGTGAVTGKDVKKVKGRIRGKR